MIEIFSKRLLFANSEEEILKKGEVVFENATAGIYSVNIPIDGLYEVIVVGGGGGCGQMALGGTQYTIAVSASGGSGAVVRGIFKISAGTLSVIVGALGKSATISSAGTSASTMAKHQVSVCFVPLAVVELEKLVGGILSFNKVVRLELSILTIVLL